MLNVVTSNRISMSLRAGLMLVVLGLGATDAPAQYDPPANYYNSATGTGSTLKQQLHNIIDNHTISSYNAARTNLQVTDRDPTDPDRIILIYDRVSLDVSNLNGSVPGWDNGVSWNREHTWPRALGVDSSGPDNSDLHMLRPSDTQVNNDRGSLHFGGAYGQPFGEVNDGGTVWYPGDADAGMVARQMFYAAVRYDGSDSATEDLELANGTPSSPRLGSLSRMLQWHYEVSPDTFELRRNHVVYDDFQGNRNPFVDRPELVWSVFGDQQNDSQVTIAGATTGGDGSSVLALNFGRAFVGSSAPGPQSVTLNKLGNDGTYFDVSTTGAATSSLDDSRHNFRTGQTDSRSLTVGLNASTSTTGLKSGIVTIDNLDVTSGGGTGRGANDANDLIAMSLEVVQHATASFSSVTPTSTLQLDFGSVDVGSTPSSLQFGIHNFSVDPNFTADLELDSINGSGDIGQLTTDLVTLTSNQAIGGGDTVGFEALLDTGCVGEFSATYQLQMSDEDLPGALNSLLSLSLTGSVVGTPLDGDYDGNGTVASEDYLVWRDAFGSTVDLAADGNGDGIVDAADFTVWRDNLGNTHPTCASVVPEPGSLWLVSISILAFLRFIRQDR